MNSMTWFMFVVSVVAVVYLLDDDAGREPQCGAAFGLRWLRHGQQFRRQQ